MAKALKPDEVLRDLRETKFIGALRLPPTNPKFSRMLIKTDGFAAEAERIIKGKIKAIEGGNIHFVNGSGREHTLNGWQRALDIVEAASHKGARSHRTR